MQPCIYTSQSTHNRHSELGKLHPAHPMLFVSLHATDAVLLSTSCWHYMPASPMICNMLHMWSTHIYLLPRGSRVLNDCLKPGPAGWLRC